MIALNACALLRTRGGVDNFFDLPPDERAFAYGSDE